jgi:hypothetical protein
LVLEAVRLGLELSDFLEGLKEGVTEERGDQVMVEGLVCVGHKRPSAFRDRNAEFAKEPADGIDAGGAADEVTGAKPVQRSDGLLIQGFHRDGCNLLVACGFQDGSGVGTVGLIAKSVARDVGGGKEGHLMAEGLDLPTPVMSGATGLHENMARRPVKEEAPEPGA